MDKLALVPEPVYIEWNTQQEPFVINRTQPLLILTTQTVNGLLADSCVDLLSQSIKVEHQLYTGKYLVL